MATSSSEGSGVLRCVIVDDDELSRAVLEHFVGRHDGLHLVASCESAIDAINVMQKEATDVVFLDVEMPNMSGLELAGVIDESTSVVLVTSKADYAVQAFELGTTDYLVKPVNYGRFHQAVERARESHGRTVDGSAATEPGFPADDALFVRVDGRLVRLSLAELEWVEAQGDYVGFRTEDRSYLVHATMKSVASNLDPGRFVRVHRSYIVRLDRISDIGDNSLVIGKQVIPIGRSYRDALMDRLRTL